MTESLRLAAMGYHFRKLNDTYDPAGERRLDRQHMISRAATGSI